MNILHITPTFYPATTWGGPIVSVYGLCNALAAIPDVALRVLSSDAAGPERGKSVPVTAVPMRYPAGYDVYFFRRTHAATFAPGMFLRLWSMIRWSDVVHLTGVYSPPTIPTLLICRLLAKPLVWSPRGSLQRWDRATNRLPKKLWEWVCNALLSPKRSVLHVTSSQEENASRGRIARAGFAVIRNGVEIPPAPTTRVWRPGGKLRLLFLGRLHPIKGLDHLIRALKGVAELVETLEIYGNGNEAYRLDLQNLVEELDLTSLIHFRGHLDGSEKAQAFQHADVCVVPSHSENFGMVVAESLAQGVPVIASKGAPWPGLEAHGCGIWCENSPDQLAEAIRRIGGMPLEEMGAKGRAWMKEEFSSDHQATAMLQLYGRLISEA